MMTRTRAWFSGLLLLVACALTNAAGAQQQRSQGGEVVRRGVSRAGLDSLRANIGFKVRVSDDPSGGWQVGTLKSVSDETLILHGRQDMRIPTQSLIVAQRSTGHAYFNPTVAGFAIGVVAGGATGVAIGNSQRTASEPNGTQRSVGLGLGAAIGGGLGALVGRALAPEHWREIRLR
jgi:hypothetical protein